MRQFASELVGGSTLHIVEMLQLEIPTRSSSTWVMCLIVLLDVWQLRLLFTSFREIHISVMSAPSREKGPARSSDIARHETIPSQVH